MKVEITRAKATARTEAMAANMVIGQVGIVRGEHYEGAVLLRTFDGLVNLMSPDQTWAWTLTPPGLPVDILRPASTILLTVET